MNFEYKKICNNLLKGLPDRTKELLLRRFGLKGGQRETLESIGQSFDITRERVRQIIEDGLLKVRPKFAGYKDVISNFEKVFAGFGNLKEEDILLDLLGGKNCKNHVFFLFVLSQKFDRFIEDDDFKTFWSKNKEAVNSAKKTIEVSLTEFGKEQKPMAIDAIFAKTKSELDFQITKPEFVSYIGISKKIQNNPEGLLGLKNWIEINPRGIKDRAFLVLRKEQKPLHFTQITQFINNLPYPSKNKAQVAVVHNELIRDPRFVLVGRGLYALKEWGYEPGVVKDVIFAVLKQSPKPLSKEEVVKKVLEKRFVKENTVLLNLHNTKFFSRNEKGKYNIKEG